MAPGPTSPCRPADGSFPRVDTAKAWLRHLPTQFSLVGVDSSRDGRPKAANASLYAQRTLPGFVFCPEVFRLCTGHPTSLAAPHGALRRALGPGVPQVLYLPEQADW